MTVSRELREKSEETYTWGRWRSSLCVASFLKICVGFMEVLSARVIVKILATNEVIKDEHRLQNKKRTH